MLLGLRNIVSICPIGVHVWLHLGADVIWQTDIGSLRTDQNNMSEQLLKVDVSDWLLRLITGPMEFDDLLMRLNNYYLFPATHPTFNQPLRPVGLVFPSSL